MPRAGIHFQLRLTPLDTRSADEPLLSFRIGHEHLPEGGVPSKLLYRVAPDGRHLAYRDWTRRRLHLRDASGVETTIDDVQRFRFSPDGRSLAVAIGRRGGPSELITIDLTLPSAPRKTLGQVKHLLDLEWLATGLVAHEWFVEGERDRAGLRIRSPQITEHALFYFPLDGSPRTLVTVPWEIARFATARRGTRVLYFARPHQKEGDPAAYLLDASTPTAPPRRLGRALFSPYNLELSPDGKQALFSTHYRVFHVDLDGDGVPRLIADVVGAHSLWFSDDGAQYLWASRERLVLHSGGIDRSFPPLAERGSKAESARFLRDGTVLILVERKGGESVYGWDPAKRSQQAIFSARAPEDLDVDEFNGRLVRLVARSDGD